MKKVEAQYVFFVMVSLDKLKRPGYSHPSRETVVPTGYDGYPCIVAFPQVNIMQIVALYEIIYKNNLFYFSYFFLTI